MFRFRIHNLIKVNVLYGEKYDSKLKKGTITEEVCNRGVATASEPGVVVADVHPALVPYTAGTEKKSNKNNVENKINENF